MSTPPSDARKAAAPPADEAGSEALFDELDALLQRMLELPVESPERAPEAGATDEVLDDLPLITIAEAAPLAYLEAPPTSFPSSFPPPGRGDGGNGASLSPRKVNAPSPLEQLGWKDGASLAPRNVNVPPPPPLAAAVEVEKTVTPSPPPPVAASVGEEKAPLTPVPSPPSTGESGAEGLAPKTADPLTPVPSPPSTGEREVKSAAAPDVLPARGPVAWLNDCFDRATIPLGYTGRWLRLGFGRTLLGWLGVAMLAVAGGLLLWGCIDWTR